MIQEFLDKLFSLEGRTAVVTGGTGVLGGAMAHGLAQAGAKVAIMGRRKKQAEQVAAEIEKAGGIAMALPADVQHRAQLESAREAILAKWGRVDILINAAGGNMPEATVTPDEHFFDVPESALQAVIGLNLMGTLLPSQVFGAVMAQQKQGNIINISSMAAPKPVTRVVAYAAAKAAVENFTKWLAVEMAQKYGQGLRVNAIAPGFYIGDQNRRLLLNEDGSLTTRGQLIIHHTPMGRFGEAEELVGATVWLCSQGAAFVTGTVVVVDGGYGASSGI